MSHWLTTVRATNESHEYYKNPPGLRSKAGKFILYVSLDVFTTPATSISRTPIRMVKATRESRVILHSRHIAPQPASHSTTCTASSSPYAQQYVLTTISTALTRLPTSSAMTA